MKVKKIISILMMGTIVLGLLTGCGSDTADDQTDDTKQETEDTNNTDESVTDTDETVSGDGKVLVVYYSASGNTEKVAEMIAQAAGADTFEVEPADPYTSEDLDWTNDDSRVCAEHDDESKREVELVSTTVDDWESYDKVFIGYPIWWGIAAWPLDGFVKANDFTGKTVIPFCTSSSSQLGESGELLAKMAGTGEWQEGMRFQSSASEEDVQAWVKSLGL